MAKCQCNNYYIKINLLKPGGKFTYYQVEQISTWCSHHICVFVWILNSNQQIGIYNQDGECLLCGMH